MFEPKPGKSSPAARVHDCNRSGVVELVGREPLMFARFESSAWQNSPRKKNAKILDQKQQFSMGNFHLFGRGKTNFWGGGITSKLASQWSQWPSSGIYKHAPPVLGRKRRLLNWKKGGQVMIASWGGQLVPQNCVRILVYYNYIIKQIEICILYLYILH